MARVLIIEPDVIIAGHYRTALERAGYETAVSHTAQDAILSADAQRPDAVVLEVLLTSHSGIEFMYEFRSYSEWQQIPVIVASRARAEDLGLDNALRQSLAISSVL